MILPIFWQSDFFFKVSQKVINQQWNTLKYIYIYTQIYAVWFSSHGKPTQSTYRQYPRCPQRFFSSQVHHFFCWMREKWSYQEPTEQQKVWTSQLYPKPFSSLGSSSYGERKTESIPSEVLSQSTSFFSPASSLHAGAAPLAHWDSDFHRFTLLILQLPSSAIPLQHRPHLSLHVPFWQSWRKNL